MADLSSKEVGYVEKRLDKDLLSYFKDGRLSTLPSYLRNINIYHPIADKIESAEVSESIKKVNEASKKFHKGLSGLSEEFKEMSDNFTKLKNNVNQPTN